MNVWICIVPYHDFALSQEDNLVMIVRLCWWLFYFIYSKVNIEETNKFNFKFDEKKQINHHLTEKAELAGP